MSQEFEGKFTQLEHFHKNYVSADREIFSDHPEISIREQQVALFKFAINLRDMSEIFVQSDEDTQEGLMERINPTYGLIKSSGSIEYTRQIFEKNLSAYKTSNLVANKMLQILRCQQLGTISTLSVDDIQLVIDFFQEKRDVYIRGANPDEHKELALNYYRNPNGPLNYAHFTPYQKEYEEKQLKKRKYQSLVDYYQEIQDMVKAGLN